MKHATTTQLYRSPNGDTWFLVRDPATGTVFVRHKANIPSGGQVTDIPIDAFLSGPRNPEHEALLSLIGTLAPDTQGTVTGDDRPVGNVGREWTDAELVELEDLLMCEISIQEIARLLQREQGDVRDKVVEIGQNCR
jgi:hypothetical protein